MRPRKSHTKSRRGCLECKRRHIKCDEKRPQCSNCKRLAMKCMWSSLPARPNISSKPLAAKTLGIVHSFNSISTSLKDDSTVLGQLAIRDLKLLHHFSIATYATLDTVVAQQRIWQEDVIQMGFQYPFVLRGILAISALHLATLSSTLSTDLLIQASTQHNRALGDFRTTLININESNCTPLFAISCLTVVHAFAVAQIQTTQDPVADILNCLHLIRGVNSVLQPYWPKLMASELSPRLDNGWRRGVAGEVPEILRLKVLVNSLPNLDNGITNTAYMQAIEQLHVVFLEVMTSDENRSDLALLFTWPITLSEKFLTLLSSRQPVAMIILAHFVAFLHYKKSYCWWLSQSNKHIINAINVSLGFNYREWLSWPKQICKIVM
ncbi:MAG: hypothetical protein M1834_005927 [Cirrosporium novae-zelandiae]|nr:MAG: hypothetical protein M1834_005927 [Cirrosporium novae-zelandiae]